METSQTVSHSYWSVKPQTFTQVVIQFLCLGHDSSSVSPYVLNPELGIFIPNSSISIYTSSEVHLKYTHFSLISQPSLQTKLLISCS